MSVDTERRTLVDGSSSGIEYVAAGTAALGVVLAVLGVTGVMKAVDVGAPVAGVPLYRLLGGSLALGGTSLLAMGAVSRTGAVSTRPDETAGLATGVGLGLLYAVGGGLVAFQTLELGAVGWPVVALLTGGVALAATVVPREDVGATLPMGVLAVAVGAVILGGAIGPDWRWSPGGFSVTFAGDIVVPAVAIVGGVLVAWMAARAYEGFGRRGKQAGAHLLVTANAVAMLSMLLALVVFIVSRGLEPVTEGVRYGLFVVPRFWFYFPPIQEYVIVKAPVLWFYWPFVMNGASLTTTINGVMPAIVGTVWLVVGAVTFAVPLGVGAAVFLTEYAEQGRFTQLVEVSTNGLWSTPSIVYGLFGLAFLVPRLGNSNSILAGQLVLGFMLMPLVIITGREALKSVPDEYRDASAALGVGKWETIKSVVLPAAMPGVITGVILGVGRIAGETAPILLVTGGAPFPESGPNVLEAFQLHFAVTPSFPFVEAGISNPSLLQPASALPYQLFAVITAGVGENEAFAWGTALVLLLVVLGFYAVGILSRIYFRRKLQA